MDAVAIDLDGTIANLSHRLHYIKEDPKDYDTFNSLVLDDSPIANIIFLVNLLITASYETSDILKFFICSGRPEKYREDTEKWLKLYVPRLYACATEILLRPVNDFRPDAVIKQEMKLRIEDKGYNIRFVLEDKESVCQMWRDNNITCLQVDKWDESWNKRHKDHIVPPRSPEWIADV